MRVRFTCPLAAFWPGCMPRPDESHGHGPAGAKRTAPYKVKRRFTVACERKGRHDGMWKGTHSYSLLYLFYCILGGGNNHTATEMGRKILFFTETLKCSGLTANARAIFHLITKDILLHEPYPRKPSTSQVITYRQFYFELWNICNSSIFLRILISALTREPQREHTRHFKNTPFPHYNIESKADFYLINLSFVGPPLSLQESKKYRRFPTQRFTTPSRTADTYCTMKKSS